LDSWLEAHAVRLDVTVAEIYEALGFCRPFSGLWRHIMLRPTDDEVTAISAATGVQLAKVRAMTLARYADIAVGIDSSTGRFVPTAPWGRVHGSRFCPYCLAATGGGWKLDWRLIWTFACLQHCCLLADCCPKCGCAQRYRYRVGPDAPHPGHCDNPVHGMTGTHRPRCDADLGQATVAHFASDHPALRAQATITNIIERGFGDFGLYSEHPYDAPQVLADIRVLGRGILSGVGAQGVEVAVPADLAAQYRDMLLQKQFHADTKKRRSRAIGLRERPPEAVTTAVAVTAALRILQAPAVESASAALLSVRQHFEHHPLAVSITTIARLSGTASPALRAVHLIALDARLGPSQQLQCRLGTRLPQRPIDDADRSARLTKRVPTLLWPQMSLQLCPPSFNQRTARLALSVAVLLVGTTLRLVKPQHCWATQSPPQAS
jgi:hypothetical protein